MRQRPRYSYNGLLTYLEGGRNKNDRPSDKASLRIVRTHEGPAVQMYRTRIATFHSNGSITIDVGGWEGSVAARDNVVETTGASIFTIAQHKKRAIQQSTRIYTHGVPSGLHAASLTGGAPGVHHCFDESTVMELLDEHGQPVQAMGILAAPQARPAAAPGDAEPGTALPAPVNLAAMAGKACPECGNHTLIHKDGCEFCTACGFVGQCG
mgnify:CR=1 FL=1